MICSADLLEFDAIKAILARYVSSPAGRRKLQAVEPGNDRALLAETLAETTEAVEYQAAANKQPPAGRNSGSSGGGASGVVRLSFESLPDVDVHAAKLRVEGSVLDGSDIRELTAVLDRACDVRAILGNTADRFPRLGALAARIADFRPLVNELNSKIEPDGSVADNASVALHRIRRELNRQQGLIQESLERFLRKHRDDGILQDEYVTFRNERFVLPIVAGQKRKVDGIIHAASGTGQTLFIEPLETVELNNDLVRLREQEMREVNRILQELTQRLRAAVTDIRAAVVVMGDLELLFGKARFAAEFECTIPVFSPDEAPRLELRRARHPLLVDVLGRQRKSVVPLALTLEGSTRTLLISGPNTGGKTVALKTIGVMVLMAQAGLPVPAERAELPMFDQVLADIGDHQSLEQSLSTFSAHIVRIKEILETVESGSLVLIDELGRATDPDEGGALARDAQVDLVKMPALRARDAQRHLERFEARVFREATRRPCAVAEREDRFLGVVFHDGDRRRGRRRRDRGRRRRRWSRGRRRFFFFSCRLGQRLRTRGWRRFLLGRGHACSRFRSGFSS